MKTTWRSHDQHHKKDPKSTREDPRYQAKSKHEDGNQAVRKITKKRAWQRWPDAALWGLDTSDQLLGNSRRQQQWSDAERSSDRTHRWHCSSSWQCFQRDRMHQKVTSDHVQKGSRAAPARPDASDRVRPDSAQSPINARSYSREDQTRPIKALPASGR